MNPTIPAVRPEDEAGILIKTDEKLRQAKTLRAAKTLIMNVRLMVRMVRDRSFEMSWASRGAILGSLLYFVIPTDLTPDFIPFVGYLDDAAIVGLVVRRLAREIERYTEHAKWS